MKVKKSIFEIFLDIILILLSILVIYWLIELIFGGSPTLSEFMLGLVLILATLFIKLNREVGETKIEMKHISKGVKEGFNKIKEDITKTKEDINNINNNLELIKSKLKIKQSE